MVQVQSVSGKIFNPETIRKFSEGAGSLAKNSVVTTMATTMLIGPARAGMVLFDKNSSKQEKAQTTTYILTSTILSTLSQFSLYKLLKRTVDDISIKNLNLSQEKDLYRGLLKLPSEVLVNMQGEKPLDSAASALKNLKLNPQKEAAFNTLIKSLEGADLPQKLKNLGKINKLSSALLFGFNTVLLTGFLIPTFTCKYLNNIVGFLHDHIKINNKSIFPEPRKNTCENKKQNNMALFGVPILAAAGILGALRLHKLNLAEGFGKKLCSMFGKLAEYEGKLSENAMIQRNIAFNMPVRSVPPLLTGAPHLAVYNFIVEMLALGTTFTTKPLIGKAASANKPAKGLIGLTINKLGYENNPRASKGVEFIITQGLQTFITLGLGLGLLTNTVSGKLKKALHIKLQENEREKENKSVSFGNIDPNKISDPASKKIYNDFIRNKEEK